MYVYLFFEAGVKLLSITRKGGTNPATLPPPRASRTCDAVAAAAAAPARKDLRLCLKRQTVHRLPPILPPILPPVKNRANCEKSA